MNDEKMKSACSYIRVSTDQQTELSPDAQKRLVLDYAKKNNILITNDDFFVDLGISASKQLQRPEFNRMIATCKSKEHPYDMILVWKFSRFTRNQEESIVYKRMLKKQGVEVVSVSEPIPDGMMGELIERILEWMDEYYSINLSQEVLRGMTEKAKRGGYQCTAPYGYVRVEKGKYEIDQQKSEVVKYIFNTFLETHCIGNIVRDLNEKGVKTNRGNSWERKTVRWILDNPFYCGQIRWNKYSKKEGLRLNDESEQIIADAGHEPIITKEVYQQVSEILGSRKKDPRTGKEQRVSAKHYLSGLMKCKYCGFSIVYNGSYKASPCFRCNGYNRAKCEHSQSTKIKDMEKYFNDMIDNLATSKNYEFIETKTENDKFDLENFYQEQLSEIEKKEKRIRKAYMDGVDTLEEYKQNKSILLSEKEKILSKMENIKSKGIEEKDDIKNRITSIKEIVESEKFSTVEKNEQLKQIISHIIYDKEEQTMTVVFFA